MSNAPSFLTAQWRNLVMLNFVVDPKLLKPYVPQGTELDVWQGRSLVSLVGFQFLKTRMKGFAIPGHQYFDEVNLRFYVLRKTTDGWRRGVVFLKEIVAKPAVSWIANLIYHENYITLPMTHHIQLPDIATDRSGHVRYSWHMAQNKFELLAEFNGQLKPVEPESEEAFVTERFWGYTQRSDKSTMEYQVDHPSWQVWHTSRAEFHGEASQLYGTRLAEILREKPTSSLVADGSEVTVYLGQRLQMAENSGNAVLLFDERQRDRDVA